MGQRQGIESSEACQASCCNDPTCSSWTWSSKASECYTGTATHFTDNDEWSGGQRKNAGEVWQKRLQPAGGEERAVAVLLFNAQDAGNLTVAVNFTDLGLSGSSTVTVKHLWQRQSSQWEEEFGPHGLRATL